MAFKDAQVISPFSREETENKDDTDDTDDTDEPDDTNDTEDTDDTYDTDDTFGILLGYFWGTFGIHLG